MRTLCYSLIPLLLNESNNFSRIGYNSQVCSSRVEMRSKILSNSWKWLASQRAQCLVNSSLGFSTRARTGDLQPAFTVERQRSFYNESRIINLSFFSRAFSSETFVDGNVSDEDDNEPEEARATAPQSVKKISKAHFVWRVPLKRRRAVEALQEWVDGGRELIKVDVQRIIRTLRRYRQFKFALQVSEWMQKHKEFEFETGDYAVHIDLIAKVHGIASAEKYFADLPENTKNKQTHGVLLHCYVREKLIEKGEQQFKKIKELGFATDAHSYDEMMTLYMATGQTDKVFMTVKHMKEMNVLPDRLCYNIWMNACSAMSDIDGVEKIVDEMRASGLNNVHWTTYSTLTNIYIKAGLLDKAESVLKETEKRAPHRNSDAYHFLITHYGSLGKKEEVYRLWQSVKTDFKRVPFANYVSVLGSLVKVGDIEGAEKIFHEWKSFNIIVNCKLSNILLDAYIKNDMLEKAEIFHGDILREKCVLNGRTWEILTEGYLESKQMSKAVVSMKDALTKEKSKEWRPKSENVMDILKHFEQQGNAEDAEEFLKLLRRFKCLTTEIYNLLLSTYAKAGKAASKVLEEMAADNVSPDKKTNKLLKLVNE